MNHTTKRFPRTSCYSPMRSPGCVSGPYRRTPWRPINWHRVTLGVVLGAMILATLTII
jgi:hypothetical protein